MRPNIVRERPGDEHNSVLVYIDVLTVDGADHDHGWSPSFLGDYGKYL